MKQLILIRHAKSDWTDPSISDFNRPLNKRGLRDAPFMASKLAKGLKNVDAIFTSSANRALTTATYFKQELNVVDTNTFIELRIYDSTLMTLLSLVNHFDDKFDVVLMFGHNPEFSEFSSYLSGLYIEMPTCGIAHISFEIDKWELVSKASGKLVSFDFPKNYL